MKYNEVHTKSPLTPDVYEFTITQAYIENERMVVCHTVDTGPKAYQHVLERVPLRGAGLGRLKRMCESLNYVWVGDPDEQEFPLQFIKLRGRMKVDMTDEHNAKNHKRTEANDGLEGCEKDRGLEKLLLPRIGFLDALHMLQKIDGVKIFAALYSLAVGMCINEGAQV